MSYWVTEFLLQRDNEFGCRYSTLCIQLDGFLNVFKAPSYNPGFRCELEFATFQSLRKVVLVNSFADVRIWPNDRRPEDRS